MQKKFSSATIVVVAFFLLTPLTLATTIFTLLSLSHNPIRSEEVLGAQAVNLIENPQVGVSVYASLPSDLPQLEATFGEGDARAEIIRNYLRNYGSPLEPYADHIVQSADNYGIDFRLITAIAQQESNLCKFIPAETYNCWGWGIHSQGTLGFNSYEDGIETVSEGLRTNYINEGFTTVDKIMSRYTPLSNGSWSEGVTQFMSDMQ